MDFFTVLAQEDLSRIVDQREGGIGRDLKDLYDDTLITRKAKSTEVATDNFGFYAGNQHRKWRLKKNLSDAQVDSFNGKFLNNLNPVQKIQARTNRRWLYFRTLLGLGFKKLANHVAARALPTAIKNQQYLVAADLAMSLAATAAAAGNMSKSEKLEKQYRNALRMYRFENLAILEYNKLIASFLKDKDLVYGKLTALINLCARLKKMAPSKPSHMYQSHYYLLLAALHEMKGDYVSQAITSSEAIMYYDKKHGATIGATMGMINNFMAACIGLNQYERSLQYENIIVNCPDDRVNLGVCLWRLQNVYLNLNRIDESIEIGKKCQETTKHHDIKEQSLISLAFAHLMKGDPELIDWDKFPHYRKDKTVLGAMVQLLSQWALLFEDVTLINDRDELTNYTDRYLSGTRTKFMFKLMTILPIAKVNPKKFDRLEAKYLKQMNEVTEVQPLETEIVSYPILWAKMKSQL